MFEYTPYVLPLLISAIVLAFLAVYAWQYYSRGATVVVFSVTMCLLLIWTAGFVLEISSVTLAGKLFWANVRFIGISLLPVTWLALALVYTDRTRTLKRFLPLLLSVPIATNIIIWTNNVHHLFRRNPTLDSAAGPFTILVNDYGPWFYWVHALYGYTLFLASFVLLVYSLAFSAGAYRRQILILVGATLLPLLIDSLYISGITPIPNLNFTPVFFTVSGLLIGWSLWRYRFLDLMPAARSALVESMDDAWIVLDAANRFVDLNPAARSALNIEGKHIIGQSIGQVLSHRQELLNRFAPNVETQAEISLDENSYYDLRLSPLYSRQGQPTGRLIILRNITKRKHMENEREKLIQELQDALVQIKTLRGLLPICANCKNIRDDGGYWHSVEAYVENHSEAEFSHGICPECMQELYPEFYDNETSTN